MNTQMTIEDKLELKSCKTILENPSFFIKLASLAGKPIDCAIQSLPIDINKAIDKALRFALETAILSIDKETIQTGIISPNIKHKVMATTSGIIGGSGGIATVALELPATTAIIMRSIAQIAHSHGFDIYKADVKMACMEVFSLGSSKSTLDDSAENSYLLSRAALAYEVKLAAEYLAKTGANNIFKGEIPIMVALIQKIASKFGIVASNKIIAGSVPLLSMATAASINYLFISHYQEMADAHFRFKKLENIYGFEILEIQYKKL